MYITTRSKIDSYTAHRVLCDGVAANGGQFLPMHLPQFTKEQIETLGNKPFCDILAEILNLFFSKNLTGWNIEFAIGRKPVKLADIGQKVLVAETWRNSENSFDMSVDRIYNLLCGQDFSAKRAAGWARIAIRIAFAFGIYGELLKAGITQCDFSVAGKDFEAAISAYYARKMGLPLGIIICGSNDNSGIWDFLNKQQIHFGAPVVSTTTPNMDDVAPVGLERLAYDVCGADECLKYADACNAQASYQIPTACITKFANTFFSSVIGGSRVADTIGSVYKTSGYYIDPYLSVAYAALQDYRAKHGENNITVLWSEKNATYYAKFISGIIGVPEKEIIIR